MDDAFHNTDLLEASHDNGDGDIYTTKPTFLCRICTKYAGQDDWKRSFMSSCFTRGWTSNSHNAFHAWYISEHAGHHIVIDAFPTLFPTEKADIAAEHDEKVEMKDWASHLMKLKGEHFARHPRFWYWVLNIITVGNKTVQMFLHSGKMCLYYIGEILIKSVKIT